MVWVEVVDDKVNWHVRELHPSIWWLVVVGLTISPIRAIVVSIFAQHLRLN